MLNVERLAGRLRLPELSPAEYERRLAGFANDYCDVVYHVLSATGSQYPPWSERHMAALVESVQRRQLPSLHVLNMIVSWVLFELRWRATHRQLTPDEIHIHEAAWRLSDCLHGPRTN